MTPGDFVTIAIRGVFAKPCPALVIQADQINAHTTLLVAQAQIARGRAHPTVKALLT